MTHQVNEGALIKVGPSKLWCWFDGNSKLDLSASSCRIAKLRIWPQREPEVGLGEITPDKRALLSVGRFEQIDARIAHALHCHRWSSERRR